MHGNMLVVLFSYSFSASLFCHTIVLHAVGLQLHIFFRLQVLYCSVCCTCNIHCLRQSAYFRCAFVSFIEIGVDWCLLVSVVLFGSHMQFYNYSYNSYLYYTAYKSSQFKCYSFQITHTMK